MGAAGQVVAAANKYALLRKVEQLRQMYALLRAATARRPPPLPSPRPTLRGFPGPRELERVCRRSN